ncbi:MAG TPA: isocitrate/isopropylmalate family dehydrogenase, partial [Thermoplasmata archaeon]|nr:isocitrate/isopropylmalate family dehydrogenase [Thermoplasmata archaeon]
MKGAACEIAVLPGDGIGPEVVREGLKVLAALAEGDAAPWHATEYAGGAQYYLAHGREWEAETEAAAHRADAVLLGAVGWPGATLPNGDIAGRALVLGLREGLDLFANVRPCRLYPGVRHRVSQELKEVWSPQNVDLVIVRENTEDLYTPARGRLRRGGVTEVAIDTRVITQKGTERIVRFAYDLVRRRGRGAPADGARRATCVDKSNVLEGCRYFRETFDRLGAE